MTVDALRRDPHELRRIARGMLAYLVLMAALATLSPFDFGPPGASDQFDMLWLADDVLLNLLLLFPPGFLAALAYGEHMGRGALRALWMGLSLSLLLELLQLLLPSRHSNLVDVAANGLGAWLGALVAQRLSRWLTRHLSDARLLELPLTGGLYMLLPLLMLAGLTAVDARRVWLTLPLGLYAVTVGSALYAQRLRQPAGLAPSSYAGGAALLFALAQLAALLRHAGAVLTLCLCLGLVLYVAARRAPFPTQRRFEESTVQRALPWLLVHWALLATLPRWWPAGARQGALSGNLEALALLELLAALTLLSYALSELFSRRIDDRQPAVLRLLSLCSVLALVSELLGGRSLSPGSLVRVLALTVGACAGVMLHRAQVGLVRALRSRQQAPGE